MLFALADVSDPTKQPHGTSTFRSYPKQGGMIAWGEITLQTFYDENKAYRNTWSRSNCDFDLARYFGTEFTLFPHPETDYIFHFDTDYGDAFKVEKKSCHPALMLNMPNHRICLSTRTRGYWKPVKVFMPRPAIFSSGWTFQNKWVERGLGMWAAAVIDLRYPWTPELAPHANQGTDIIKNEAPPWWDPSGNNKYHGIPKWLAGYWQYLDNGGADGQNPDYLMQQFGPFVVNKIETSVNILMTYKSYWQWGGDWAKPAVVCDPKPATAVSDPSQVISPDDLDKWGLLTKRSLRRIIDGRPRRAKRKGLAPFSGFLSEDATTSEEETDGGESDEVGSFEEIEEMEEDGRPEQRTREERATRRSRDRVQQLLRLVGLLAGQHNKAGRPR